MTSVYFLIQPIISTFYLHTKTKPAMTINQRQKFLKYHVHLVDHRTHLLSFEVGSNCDLLFYWRHIYRLYIHCLGQIHGMVVISLFNCNIIYRLCIQCQENTTNLTFSKLPHSGITGNILKDTGMTNVSEYPKSITNPVFVPNVSRLNR